MGIVVRQDLGGKAGPPRLPFLMIRFLL
jgi:hypothetical protein